MRDLRITNSLLRGINNMNNGNNNNNGQGECECDDNIYVELTDDEIKDLF